MIRKQYTVLVGLFALVAIVVLAYMILQLGGGPRRYGESITVVGEFNQAGGLIENAPVYFSGVEIGTVDKIEISGTGQVLVHVRVAKFAKVRETDVPEIVQRGVLGDVVVNFIRGEEQGPLAGHNHLFTGKDPVDIIRRADEIIGKTGEFIEKAGELMGLLTSEETVGSVQNILSNVEEITGQIREDLANLRQLFTPEFFEDARVIVANTRKASDDLPELIGQAALLFRETRLNTTQILKQISRNTARFDSILASIDEILAAVAEGEGTLGGLLKDRALYDSTVLTLDALRDAVVAIKYHGPFWGKRVRAEEEAERAQAARRDKIWRW
jgi:phospholipid/cholesterol/gamma-HCH transport system substrate-binding protein